MDSFPVASAVPAVMLELAAATFLFHAADLGGMGGTRSTADFRFLAGLMQQVNEALQSIRAVLVLGAITACFDDKHSLCVDAAAAQYPQTQFYILRQRWRVAYIKAELDRSGYFIHAL